MIVSFRRCVVLSGIVVLIVFLWISTRGRVGESASVSPNSSDAGSGVVSSAIDVVRSQLNTNAAGEVNPFAPNRQDAPSVADSIELAESGEHEDVIALLAEIEKSPPEIRSVIARSLQALRSASGNQELEQFLLRHTDDPNVAIEVRDALARLATPTDVVRISQAIPPSGNQDIERSLLLSALERVRNPDAISELGELCLLSKDEGVQSAAARALAGIGTPAAVWALVSVIEESRIEDVSHPVSQALAASGNKDLLPLFEQELFQSTNPVVQYCAAFYVASVMNSAQKPIKED